MDLRLRAAALLRQRPAEHQKHAHRRRQAAARGGKSTFTDTFVPLAGEGPWVLSERVVETEAFGDTPAGRQVFRFEDLNANS